ncbi:MAG: FAD-dependent oxidoreductase [Xanthomonadales bacterium]|nr:FAD-dependent oxidoreductase [Xanthomonadales bacterium]
MIDVVVVGAGWSGLTAATRLASQGYSVVVVEKSRGPGGRSATRRQDGFAFDHGAQYLTARSDAFARQIEAWAGAGLLAPWRPRLSVFGQRPENAGGTPADRWVGVSGMNAVPHRLAEGLDCRWRWQVEGIEFDGREWQVVSSGGDRLRARSLLLTAPPAQSAALLGEAHPLSATLVAVCMQPCLTVMLGFDQAPAVSFDAAFVNQGPLAWIARNDDKPGHPGGPAWIAQASSEWSRENLESSPESVASELHAAMIELDAAFDVPTRLCIAHRWRYARAGSPLSGPILAEDANRLVLAGDWCAGERIEGAWISGMAAAKRLAALL